MFIPRAPRAPTSQVAWAVARRLGTFGYADISAGAHISMHQAMQLVKGWVADGSCINIYKVNGKRSRFQVQVAAPSREPQTAPTALPGSVPLNLWTAMRGLKSFTPTDLAAHSSTASVPVKVDAAQGYCQALLRGGYLRIERPGVPGRREAIYRLIRNTGPFPPRERRVRGIWDDNLDEFVLPWGRGK
jgi:hypothetical protein